MKTHKIYPDPSFIDVRAAHTTDHLQASEKNQKAGCYKPDGNLEKRLALSPPVPKEHRTYLQRYFCFYKEKKLTSITPMSPKVSTGTLDSLMTQS